MSSFSATRDSPPCTTPSHARGVAKSSCRSSRQNSTSWAPSRPHRWRSGARVSRPISANSSTSSIGRSSQTCETSSSATDGSRSGARAPCREAVPRGLHFTSLHSTPRAVRRCHTEASVQGSVDVRRCTRRRARSVAAIHAIGGWCVCLSMWHVLVFLACPLARERAREARRGAGGVWRCAGGATEFD